MKRTTNLTIRMDEHLKKEADALFTELGMNLTTAFNIFLRQSLRVQGLPFEVTRETPNKKTLAAMREAERIARDPKAKGFKDMKSLLKDVSTKKGN